MAPSPLREFLHARIERLAAAWEAAVQPGAGGASRQAVRRFLEALDELDSACEMLAAGAAEVERGERRDVLLVASDAALGAAVRAVLEPDHRVEVAAPGTAFRIAAARRTPDVLVACDAAALEAMRTLRELMPGVPAIVVSRADGTGLAEAFAADPVVVMRDPASAEDVALTVRGLLAAGGPQRRENERPHAPGVELGGNPRSYAHLAGLLPRAIERTIAFDVAAAVVARPEAESIVEVYATSEQSEDRLQLVRERALATFRVAAGHPETDEAPAGPERFPFLSTLHVPLATEGRVVGIVLVAALREDAFSADDQQVLTALAAHASGAYRRLEASLRRLRLTPRQSQILSLIASGLSDKQVAARLGLAHRTIRTHLDRLLREHGLHSRTEAVAAWLRGQQG